MKTAQELIALKERIARAERKANELEGIKKKATQDLKDMGFASIAEAKAKIEKLQSQIDELEEKLMAGVNVLADKLTKAGL